MNTKILLPLILVAAALLLAVLIFVGLDTSAGDRPRAIETAPEASAAADTAAGSAADVAYADLGPRPVSIIDAAESTREELPPSLQQALLADTTRDEAAREVVLDAIDEATVTYDIQGLVTLGPLLSHPDPAIREAAIEGIVQLGETAGSGTLRDAARKTKDRAEAAAMIEAAQFLELPVLQPASQ